MASAPEPAPWEQYQTQAPAPPQAAPGLVERAGEQFKNAAGGLVRGAGSIGATLLAPVDAAARALGVQNDFIGRTDRREAMDGGLQALGADPNSLAYAGGKIAGEVAGTAGVGSVLANGARAVGAAAPIVEALATSGLRAGGVAGRSGAALRAGAGAATGAASAGLVDPSAADTGAVVGAVLPSAVKVAGKAGDAVTRVLSGPSVPAAVQKSVAAARGAGYVVPPTQAKPTLGNRLLEGFAGKLTTAQNASARNQEVTNGLVRKALGLPEKTPLDFDALDAVRKEAGQAYAAVSNMGPIDVGTATLPASLRLTQGAATAIGPATLVKAWRQLNNDATGFYRAYGRDANPMTLDKAKAASAASKQIDDFLATRLGETGQGDMLQALKDARVRIAKSYTAEGALNPATGNVNAAKLAADLLKRKPLSGELKQVAEFASAFPTAAKVPERMGSLPQTSPFDFGAAGIASVASGNPLYLAGLLARPAARAAALSGPVQNKLAVPVARSAPQLTDESPDLLRLLLARAAPVAVGGR